MEYYKLYFKLMDYLFPSLAAKKVYHVMSNPRIRKLKDFEEDVLSRSKIDRIKYKKFEIQKYTWGNPTHKRALLIHGWEG